ncbi:hypothetical protein JAGODDHD_02920 [Sphingomonas paucimobilis]|nr:hypothetical protein [Sphingomonas paucimobilis]
MSAKAGADRADFEGVGIPSTAIEGLRGKGMDNGDQGHVRLLAKGETQGKGAMGGQVADERVRQGLAVFLRFLVLGVERGNVVPVLVIFAVFPDDFAIGVDAHPVDDGAAVCAFGFLRLRGLVLGTDETALDAGFPIMVQNHENAASRDLVWIVGIAQPVDPLDLGFKLRKTLIHFGREVRICVLPFR